MKKSSSLSSKPFLSQHHRGGGGPSLRSILVLTALTLYGLQSFLSHFSTFNTTTPRRSSYPSSTSSSSSNSRTTFGVPFPTSQSTHQRSRSRERKQQQHTYSPQERQQHQQTWYNDNDNDSDQEPLDHRTAFEKKYFSDPSYFPFSDDDYNTNYDNTNTPHSQSDTFGAYDEYEAREILPGSECKGYYCAETDTCVDQPINCPCPHVLDTKCFRSDWFVCFRGPHQC